MKQLIHKIVTDIKYLYSCIAYEQNSSDTELEIITETKLNKIYPIKKSVTGMTYVGEDYWGRDTFKKDINENKSQFYCDLDGELYFKGNDKEGEPNYPISEIIVYELPDLDANLIEFKPLMDSVENYANNSVEVDLISKEPSLHLNTDNVLESKIICSYKFKIL